MLFQQNQNPEAQINSVECFQESNYIAFIRNSNL